ncbi:ribosome recycling factor [bacterium]|jgi:ribosome recycling factor|nr:ribosome recycling factor [bacterium]MBT4121604.1 ribosome recycling factor [bacterium]MBT4334992.1 ribosome recycling factor [bacterium]MBT4496051.1 ribosome recycling factor [bacterium]MBT4764020.1 ribosome recycling factor [bacterium]
MIDYIDNFKPNFVKAIDHFKSEMANLRIGRATPSILENIIVNAYETPTPLVQLAGIQSPEPKVLTIQPWDKTLLKQIASSIEKANLGVSTQVDEQLIRITFPALTEENRIDIVKQLHKKTEDARVAVRNQREKIKKDIDKEEKEKVISEDNKFKRIELLDQLVKDYNDEIKDLSNSKEKEIMTV